MAFGRLFLSVVGVGFDLVICTPEPPSTWYIQISLEPIPNCAFETKMYFPSGAQLGEVNSLLASLETCFTPVPSGCMIQMFSLPSRSEMKDRKSTRLNSSHSQISYAVFCLKKKNE